MPAAPVGATVTIAPYDFWGEGPGPSDGDFLISQGGSVYHILEAQQTRRQGRYRLTCRKVSRDDLPADATSFSLQWSRRDRRPR